MKARDIKKRLLSDCEDAILEYEQLIQTRIKAIDDAKTYIKILEKQLFEIYGISQTYVFKED